MTTTWQILDTQSQIADGLITNVSYMCRVQLEREMDMKVETLTLEGDPTSTNFIPFSDLTEENLIGWVKSILGEETVTAIETQLQETVTARKAAKDAETTKRGLPWRQ